MLSLGGALSQSGQLAVIKGAVPHVPPIVLVAWGQAMGAAGWAAWLALTSGPFVAPPGQWAWIGLSVVLAAAVNYLLARGSARGDIGIVGAVLALSPVFTIAPDAALTGTWPRGLGWLGLALSVVGIMSLSGRTSLAASRELFRRPDARDALGAAVLLGLLGAVDRRNGLAMGVATYLLWSHGITAVATALVAVARVPRVLGRTLVSRDLVGVLAFALGGALGTGMQLVAMMLAPASYVNAIRRSSAIFTVLLGALLFHEPGLRGRLLGALLASLGAVCLLAGR